MITLIFFLYSLIEEAICTYAKLSMIFEHIESIWNFLKINWKITVKIVTELRKFVQNLKDYRRLKNYTTEFSRLQRMRTWSLSSMDTTAKINLTYTILDGYIYSVLNATCFNSSKGQFICILRNIFSNSTLELLHRRTLKRNFPC